MNPKINEKLLILSEAIRTEGYIMKENNMQGAAVSNKDMNILSLIESAYKSIYSNRNTSKLLIIVLYLPNNTEVNKIINTTDKKELNFNIDKNNRLIAIQHLDNFDLNLDYLIITKSEDYSLGISLSDEGIIKTKSKLHSTAYATLQIYNAKFMRFLHKKFEIPVGIGSRKSYEIGFPFDINKLSLNQIRTIINIVISCEGCVFHNKIKKDRVIKIK